MERNVKNGFTLVEVLISMLLMGIVALALGTVITSTVHQHTLSFTHDEAYAIAREKLAELQVVGAALSDGSDVKISKNISYSRNWVIDRDTDLTGTDDAQSAVRAVITVSWTSSAGSRTISVTGYVSGRKCSETGTTTVPTNLVLSPAAIMQNLPALTEVGKLSVTDPDIAAVGDIITYEMVSGGTHNASFIIQGDRLYTASILGSGTYTISVRATDCSGGSVSRTNIPVIVTAVPTYSVTYDANTGIGTPPATVSYNENTEVTVAAEGSLTKANHLFNGWNTEVNGAGTSYSAGAKFNLTENITLYARWVPTANNKVVTFDPQAGTVSPAQLQVETDNAINQNSSPNNVLPTPIRSGFRFDGWFNSINGGGGAFTSSTVVSVDRTVYAKWTPVFKVIYLGNGSTSGSVPVDNTEYAAGELVTVLGNTGNLGMMGYQFSGWNTQLNGLGTDRAGGSSFTMGSADVTLFAKWAIQRTVTFDQQGGSGVGFSSKVVPNGGVVNPLPAAPTKSGVTFGGWWTQINGGGSQFTASTAVNSSLTVYAKWVSASPCAGVPTWIRGTVTPSNGQKFQVGGRLYQARNNPGMWEFCPGGNDWFFLDIGSCNP